MTHAGARPVLVGPLPVVTSGQPLALDAPLPYIAKSLAGMPEVSP